MLFNSYVFILFFFPAVFCGYFILNKYKLFNTAKIYLIIGSLYFYSYFKLSYLPIMIISILLNYWIGTVLHKHSENKNGNIIIKKFLLTLGVILNLGILFYFKYIGFFAININQIFSTQFTVLQVILPLGISFYTFQQLSFVIDSYYGKSIRYNLIDYALFVTFFPQLIAGPIVLPSEMLPQFDDKSKKKMNFANMNVGLFLFSLGLVKKCVFADSFACIANTGFDSDTTMKFVEAWLTSLSFTLQLYFDFSGYCDMAMGIAKFFNINLPINFNSPYKSTDFQDFWRRWHITLGRFMMNYLYIPLGGNRSGEIRTIINLLIVFIASGLWHGAGWLFLIWGGLHGLGILIHRLWRKYFCGRFFIPQKGLPNIVGVIITFFFVNLFWIFFRATTIERAYSIIKSMLCQFNIWSPRVTYSFVSSISTLSDGYMSFYEIFILMFFALIIIFIMPNSNQIIVKIQNRLLLGVITIFLFVIGFLFVGRVAPFLYFNF